MSDPSKAEQRAEIERLTAVTRRCFRKSGQSPLP
jgi:hypothetical protein